MRSERIESLKNQHTQLEHDLASIRQWPSADMARVQALKRQKLLIKDLLVSAAARQQAERRPY